jgi:RNase H-fold protein (predicted Holliday junction resolvase)
MTNPTRIEVNCKTGIESIIELTDEEMAEMEAAAAIEAQKRAEAEAQAEADAAAKQAILDRLGLTADEAALLLK